MQLKHEIRRELHAREIRVDCIQNVTVSRDLLFGAVRRFGALGNQIADPLRRGHDALDAVRGLSAMNDGVLPKCLEHLR